MGWNDSNKAGAFGTDPARRTRDGVHDQTNEFVLKGVEFFNGRGTRSLDSGLIDFEDLNPWSDAAFVRGEAHWDKGLWDGLSQYHEILADTLEYSFTSSPDERFIRKVYQAGGSDAHGDWPQGTYLLNPEGFRHTPFSKPGCLLCVKLRQFPGRDRRHLVNDTNALAWEPSPAPGVAHKPLYQQDGLAHLGYQPGAFPETDLQADSIISFPADQHLSPAQRDIVVETVRAFYAGR